ncbi:hypothetical protein D3C81_1623690 [compost metagenome]
MLRVTWLRNASNSAVLVEPGVTAGRLSCSLLSTIMSCSRRSIAALGLPCFFSAVISAPRLFSCASSFSASDGALFRVANSALKALTWACNCVLAV